MALSVERWLCKRGDLSLSSSTQAEKQSVVARACNLSAGEAETGGYLGLAGQLFCVNW